MYLLTDLQIALFNHFSVIISLKICNLPYHYLTAELP